MDANRQVSITRRGLDSCLTGWLCGEYCGTLTHDTPNLKPESLPWNFELFLLAHPLNEFSVPIQRSEKDL